VKRSKRDEARERIRGGKETKRGLPSPRDLSIGRNAVERVKRRRPLASSRITRSASRREQGSCAMWRRVVKQGREEGKERSASPGEWKEEKTTAQKSDMATLYHQLLEVLLKGGPGASGPEDILVMGGKRGEKATEAARL